MAKNDAKDYNPDSILSPDYEPMRFDEIEDDDLFWLGNADGNNPAFRKINENQGYNTRDGIVSDFVYNQTVYQRT